MNVKIILRTNPENNKIEYYATCLRNNYGSSFYSYGNTPGKALSNLIDGDCVPAEILAMTLKEKTRNDWKGMYDTQVERCKESDKKLKKLKKELKAVTK